MPLIIIHRINTAERLEKIPRAYGVEIDVREYGGRLILNHDPFTAGERFEDYIAHFRHGFLVVNIKETGVEEQVRKTLAKAHIKNYFLLDVEFPYIYKASREGVREIALRFSEEESLETVRPHAGRVDWVWVDTMTKLPITRENIPILSRFKTCLVSPEFWGRPEESARYIETLKELGYAPDAVMTTEKYAPLWQSM